MHPPTRPTRDDATGRAQRFTVTVRGVHASVAVLMLVCIATAAVLYNGSLSIAIGHRYVVEQVHVWCGFALPVPLIIGLLSPSYRSDLKRLNRFTDRDWAWLRSSSRRSGQISVGKFNAGQKLNAAISAGSIAVLLGSGIVMYFPSLTRLSWRSGATFIHDWFALGLGLLVVGHIVFALGDSEAMTSMLSGSVTQRWARRNHPEWAAEVFGEQSDDPPPNGPTPRRGV